MRAAPRITVLIADDQAMVREGFRSLLGHAEDLSVVAEAANGEEAIDQAREYCPDVILMDIRMPVLDGLAATRRIVAELPESKVVMLTTFDLDEHVFEGLRSGASGFLLKDAPAEELIRAVRTVAGGAALLDPAVTRRVIETFAAQPSSVVTRPAARLDILTAQERDVLALVARGLTNAEIADELVISEATAKTHVSNLLTKLDLRDRVQAVVIAYETASSAGD